MRKKKSSTQKPMLYIQQPNLGKPSAAMQSIYRTPKKKKTEATANKKKKVIKKMPHTSPVEKEETDVVYSDKEAVIEELEDEVKVKEELESEEKEHKEKDEEEESIRPRATRKRFGEMTIEEKVHYFVGLPSQVPKMRCEVRTSTERHHGFITDYKDGFVLMTTIRRPKNKEIDINEIENIRILSF